MPNCAVTFMKPVNWNVQSLGGIGAAKPGVSAAGQRADAAATRATCRATGRRGSRAVAGVAQFVFRQADRLHGWSAGGSGAVSGGGGWTGGGSACGVPMLSIGFASGGFGGSGGGGAGGWIVTCASGARRQQRERGRRE